MTPARAFRYALAGSPQADFDRRRAVRACCDGQARRRRAFRVARRQRRALCEDAARHTARVLPDPEPKCLFIEIGESALKLQLRFWIGDAQNGVQNVKSDVLIEIWGRFKEQGVRVPYPQRDLHVRSGIERAPLQALA